MPFNPFSALTSKIFGAIAVAALAFATLQTVRIEGFLFIHGYKERLAERDAAIASLVNASDEARALAEAQNKDRQDKLDEATKDARNEHTSIAVDTGNRFASYRDRMRTDKICGVDPAPSPERENPGVPANLPADTGMVAVRSDDLQALVEWFAIGLAAHNNAVAKVEAGVAEADTALPAPAMSAAP